MRHIDEHTLELYVLGAGEVRGRRRSIRNHLSKCAGCREVARRLEDIYEDVNTELSKNEEVVIDPGKKIASVSQSLEWWNESVCEVGEATTKDVASFREVGLPVLWRRICFFWTNHPVTSSSLGVTLLAAIVLTVVFAFRSNVPPSYYRYDSTLGNLAVYSSGNRLLWSVPVSDAGIVSKRESETGVSYTILADLNGDGKKDVITSLLVGKESPPSPLNVFDSDGRLVSKFSFPKLNVNFRGVHYDAAFGAGNILKMDMPDGKINFFVASSVGQDVENTGRSPSVLWRLSDSFQVLGEYWHYGCFKAYLIGSPHHLRQFLVLIGTDDMEEMSANNFTFVAVLDPLKLTGAYESSATRGFGFRRSPAELYYVKLPNTDLQRAIGLHACSMMDGIASDSVFYVGVRSHFDLAPPGSYGFDYVFSVPDFSVREVKFVAPTAQTYAMLKREGKVKGIFGERYLNDLKDGVRYWNGQEWVKEPTRIVHDGKTN